MKGARASRRGMQRGLQRRTVGQRQNRSDENNEENNVLTDSESEAKPSWRPPLELLARTCFGLTFSACSKLCLIQVVQDPYTKQYKVAPLWRRCINLVIWLLFVVSMVRNMWVCVERLAVSMDLVTLTCLGGFWGQVTGIGVAYGVVAQPEKTAQLLNAWSSIATHMEVSLDFMWESQIVCAQTVVTNTGQILFPLIYPLIGLIIPSVPIFALRPYGKLD